MNVAIDIVNAFTDGGSGGNPAAVVLDAGPLDATQRLQVARAVALSETAFVSASDVATIRLEFFTPTRQIAHCGHATIATFCLLRERGLIADGVHSKETIDGLRRVTVRDGVAAMEQRAPTYHALDPVRHSHARLVAALGPASRHGLAGAVAEVVETGNRFLVVPLADAASVAALTPDQAEIARISEELDLIGVYAFSPEAGIAGRDAGARMFAPRYGIDEESATGMAAGPLACYLRDRLARRKARFLIEQGRLMSPPSPSVIEVALTRRADAIESVEAGGRATWMRRIELSL
jgi:PhzF family phenazine biosynthesis protein